ncbi:unnamed protein product [marine sediment metagenome]|uniref:Uncharacterized protein n=1 Tax=marine sediment metagenome TaxID=412755 RepID=X1CCU8_9ZZZZ
MYEFDVTAVTSDLPVQIGWIWDVEGDISNIDEGDIEWSAVFYTDGSICRASHHWIESSDLTGIKKIYAIVQP